MPSELDDGLPILYSFRRCPYAIRARLALAQTKTNVIIREVELKNKPEALIQASAKGTVPVMILPNGTVIDESLDIMIWAETKQDKKSAEVFIEEQDLIQQNDNEFKYYLDRYKYADRYPEHSKEHYQSMCLPFLMQIESLLLTKAYLNGEHYSFLDFVLFPFVRQFAKVDEDWFKASHFNFVKKWLNNMETSSLFKSVMHKYTPWQAGDKPQYLLPQDSI